MKFRFPLYAQIISVFALNLVLLVALQFAIFGRHNFAWESFINNPIADRVQSIAMDMHWKLRSKPRDKWNSVLKEFGDFYGVKFAIFDADGKQVAGESLQLPRAVRARIFMPHIAMSAVPSVMPFTTAIAGKSVPAPFTVATRPGAFQVVTPNGLQRFTPGTPVGAPVNTVAESVGTIAVPTGTISAHTVAVSGAPPMNFQFGTVHFGPHGERFGTHHGPHPGERLGPHPGERFGPPPGMFFFDQFMVGPPHPPPPPRFFINTKNPDRSYIGAMIPISALEEVTSISNPRFVTAPKAGSTSATATLNSGSTFASSSATSARTSVSTTYTTSGRGTTTFLRRIPMPETLIAVTPNVWQTRLIAAFGNMFLAVAGVFCFSLVVWFPFVHQMTRALGKLTMATEEIADGKFDSVLKVRRFDEIGRLALAINTMSSKLNTYVTGQKRFLGDIAHELCSPIARLQVAIELLESSSKSDQKETIQDIREEVEQMSMLINELLAFSKASMRGRETQLRSIDLTQILEETTAKIDSQAFVLNASPNIHCLGDDILIKRALENILRNAVRYAGDQGPITVDCVRNGSYVMVSVVDCGPGVPEEAIDSLGQPFYRPEESRSRSSGGVGLGLAIVKTCVEACNGSFSVRNMHPKGLRVDIILTASEQDIVPKRL